MELTVNGERRQVTLRREGSRWIVEVDGRPLAIDLHRRGDAWSLLVSDAVSAAGATVQRSWEAALELSGRDTVIVHLEGHAFAVGPPELHGELRESRAGSRSGSHTVVAPMPGRVVRVLVEQGAQVAARQPLVVVEAMKMENELRAPRAGVVARVLVAAGTLVEARQSLVELEL